MADNPEKEGRAMAPAVDGWVKWKLVCFMVISSHHELVNRLLCYKRENNSKKDRAFKIAYEK